MTRRILIPLCLLSTALLAPVARAEGERIDVPSPTASTAFLVRGKVTQDEAHEFRFVRTTVLDAPAPGHLVLAPVEVRASGKALRLSVAYGPEGRVEQTTLGRNYLGKEGPSMAIWGAPLGYLWGAAEARTTGATLGYPTEEAGARPVAGRWVETDGPIRSHEATEDPLYFHLHAAPELDLLAVFPQVAGPWEFGEEREVVVPVARGDGLAPWRLEGTLTYVQEFAGNHRFRFAVRYGGPVFERVPAWLLERETKGEFDVTPEGALHQARLLTTAHARAADGEADHARVQTDATMEPTPAPTPIRMAPYGAGAAAFAARLRHHRDDPDGFAEVVVRETLRAVQGILEEVRPDAPVDGATAKVWTADVDVGALAREERLLAESPLALAVLDANAEALLRLGLVDETTVEAVRARFPGGSGGLSWAAAFAIPSQGLVLVKPEHVGDMGVMAHELAHLASEQQGYFDRGAVGMAADADLDPAWVDLDGAIAAWALGEAEAGVTEGAVRLGAGSSGLIRMTAQRSIRGLVPPPATEGVFEHLLHLLYGASPRVIVDSMQMEEPFEVSLRRAWKTYPYQTRRILAPRAATERSAMWPRALALRERGAVGASRVGAFVLGQALFRSLGQTLIAAAEIRDALLDDAVVRFPEGVFWATRWSDDAAAGRFASVYGTARKDAIVRIRGAYVLVEIGTLPDADALADVLLGDVR